MNKQLDVNNKGSKPVTNQKSIKPASSGNSFASYRKEIGIFILLIVLCIVVAIQNKNFVSIENLENMARLIGLFGIFSLGMGIVIITGGIDLSVGSVLALEGVILANMLLLWHVPAIAAVIIAIVLCAGLGYIHGMLITRVPLQPFIVTLCGLLFYRGLARFITGDETRGFGDSAGFTWLKNYTTNSFFHFPAPFITMIILSIVIWVLLHRSVFGRYLYAVGRNEDAAHYSGINSKNIITAAYVLSGVLAGIAGIMFAFYTNSVQPSGHGNSYELYGIAAAVLGGCSLRGGEGTVIGIIIGTALLQVLQNLVNMLGFPSSLNFAVMGAVILIGVTIDELFKRRAAKVLKA